MRAGRGKLLVVCAVNGPIGIGDYMSNLSTAQTRIGYLVWKSLYVKELVNLFNKIVKFISSVVE